MKTLFTSRIVSRKVFFLLLFGTLVMSGVALAAILRDQSGADRSVGGKHVSFAVLEDYDKGDDLNDIAG